MGLWDMLVDNILEPASNLLIEGVEATGRGIDTVVTTGIDVIGGGLDKAVEIVKEHPVETAIVVGAAVSGGVGGFIGTAARTAVGAAGALSTATTTASGTAVAAKTIAAVAATASQTSSSTGMSLINAGAIIAKEKTRDHLLAAAGSIGAVSAAKSVIDNHLRDKVKPVMGSVLYCDLAGAAEHSGIYVGRGKIVHLDGSGQIEMVTAKQFLKRLYGLNPAMTIYVSSNEKKAVGSTSVANRAKQKLGETRSYNLILDNCHQFASGCITGNFDNSDNFLWMLKHTAEQAMDATSWRAWDFS